MSDSGKVVANIDPLAEFFVSEGERAEGEGAGERVVTSGGNNLELLAFWLADEQYAIDINEIQEIIKVPRITSVPRVATWVLGIISLRGEIVPVLDARQIMRLDPTTPDRRSRVLVLRADGDPIGLMVDTVASVKRIPLDGVEPTPRTMQHETSELLEGVGRIGEEMLILLDTRALISVLDSAA